jgi:hypothetical protein
VRASANRLLATAKAKGPVPEPAASLPIIGGKGGANRAQVEAPAIAMAAPSSGSASDHPAAPAFTYDPHLAVAAAQAAGNTSAIRYAPTASAWYRGLTAS